MYDNEFTSKDEVLREIDVCQTSLKMAMQSADDHRSRIKELFYVLNDFLKQTDGINETYPAPALNPNEEMRQKVPTLLFSRKGWDQDGNK